jgi:hypothetical protein
MSIKSLWFIAIGHQRRTSSLPGAAIDGCRTMAHPAEGISKNFAEKTFPADGIRSDEQKKKNTPNSLYPIYFWRYCQTLCE